MSKLIVIPVIIGLILFGFLSLSSAQENLTITTYYPSPYGSYMDLRVSNQLSVGPISDIFSPTGASHPGAVSLSGSDAGLYLVDRNLNSGTLNHPWIKGQVYYWYNLGREVKVSDGFNNILQIVSNINGSYAPYPNGSVGIYSGREITNDPLNGVNGYTAQGRYSDNTDSTVVP